MPATAKAYAERISGFMLKYSCAAVTKKGRRSNNQDNYIINNRFADLEHVDNVSVCSASEKKRLFAAVADGMGGEASGERASYLAVASLSQSFECYEEQVQCRMQLENAVLMANDAVCSDMNENGAGQRMGSTVVALYINGTRLTYTNLGDSRLYMIRDKKVIQLTQDHTEGQVMLDAGILTPQQLKQHPARNRLNRYLGIFGDEMSLETPLYDEVEVRNGDVFLLCSDGVSGAVDEQLMCDILSGKMTAEQKANALVDCAFENGSTDNMTAVVISAGSKADRNMPVMTKYAVIAAAIVVFIVALALMFLPIWKGEKTASAGGFSERNNTSLFAILTGKDGDPNEYNGDSPKDKDGKDKKNTPKPTAANTGSTGKQPNQPTQPDTQEGGQKPTPIASVTPTPTAQTNPTQDEKLTPTPPPTNWIPGSPTDEQKKEIEYWKKNGYQVEYACTVYYFDTISLEGWCEDPNDIEYEGKSIYNDEYKLYYKEKKENEYCVIETCENKADADKNAKNYEHYTPTVKQNNDGQWEIRTDKFELRFYKTMTKNETIDSLEPYSIQANYPNKRTIYADKPDIHKWRYVKNKA